MKDTLYKAFETKYEELKEALSGDDFNSNDVSSHDAYSSMHRLFVNY